MLFVIPAKLVPYLIRERVSIGMSSLDSRLRGNDNGRIGMTAILLTAKRANEALDAPH